MKEIRLTWVLVGIFAMVGIAAPTFAGTDCGNATCDSGEDSCSCPGDCPDDPFSCSSCECGGASGADDCWCDDLCASMGDCCSNVCDACGYCGPACGNGTCESGEDPCNCAIDCPNDPNACEPCECGGSGGNCFCDAICVVPPYDCCAGVCDACGIGCSFECGNGTCESGEDSCVCPEDCPDDPNSCSYCECNDSAVAGQSCACDIGCTDRGDCCDDVCNFCLSCGPQCGDGICSKGEGCDNCPSDCEFCGACCVEHDVTAGGNGGPSCYNTSEGNCLKGYGGEFQGAGILCNPYTCAPVGACCFEGGNVAGPNGYLHCGVTNKVFCDKGGGTYLGDGTECNPNTCNPQTRLDTVKKGSLLVFPAVELRWAPSVVAGPGSFTLTRDTIITLVNDFTRDVHIKLYFVNGDAPTEPIYADDLQTILIERGHNGWNQVDCGIELTENESTYLSLANGGNGCQRFTILDPGNPPGRPNLEPDGGRVLRGFVIAFAVDENQNEISFNHLSGHATVIDYDLRSAWEYQSYAFQAINPTAGAPTDGIPGQLNLDGVEYDYAFNQLIFDFYAVGSTALSTSGVTVMLDTDLTLHPVSADLRQDSCGPITTKAHFDIWNANEEFRSGTTRCITCWDQTLLSAYSVGFGEDNNFILGDLDTDKGKARIDGMASVECDDLFINDFFDLILDHFNDRCPTNVAGPGQPPNGNHICCDYSMNESQDAALLGVAAKILNFSGGASGRTHAGMNLVGAGLEAAQILFDIPAGPESAASKERRPEKNASERNSLGNRDEK